MDIIKIFNISNRLKGMINTRNIMNINMWNQSVINIKNDIDSLVKDVEKEHPIINKQLKIANDTIFSVLNNNIFQLKLIACGKILALLNVLYEIYNQKKENVWFCIHPRIIEISKQLYLDGHYADAALDAFKEINSRMKEIYKKINPEDKNIPDGSKLMNNMFSDDKAILKIGDLNDEDFINIQKGTRFMLLGAFFALRNPPSHSNKKLTAEEAMRRLMFASMLMYKIDEAVKYTEVQE